MLKIGILLTKQYKLLSIAAILDVFETVNKYYVENKSALPYQIAIYKTRDILTDDAFGYTLINIEDSDQTDLLLIPSFASENLQDTIKLNRAYLPWLVSQYKKGTSIATFCTGAFLLAATELLNDKIATTHVDACQAFGIAFPKVKLQPDKTVTQDGKLYTSGGATSTFHLLLYLIQQHCGKEVAVWAAKKFAIDMDRHNQSYFSSFTPVKNHHDQLVAVAQSKIENSYQEAATIEEIIKDIPASRRNMVRRFKQVTGITPIAYLQLTRIEAAKKLLEQTGKQMNEIIFDSGYNDPKAFRKVFRKTVGMTPTEYRDKFQAS